MAKKPKIITKASPKAAKPEGAAVEVSIDYPQQDEGIPSESYTFRIGSVRAEKVEVSIDRGPWLACRPAEGYWWYDWSNYAPGIHRLTARALGAGGAAGMSAQRRFQVIR